METGITWKFESGIWYNIKKESAITESGITESGITRKIWKPYTGPVAELLTWPVFTPYKAIPQSTSTIMIIQPCLITNVTLATTFSGA